METHRKFPHAKEAWPRDLNDSLRLQSHLTLVVRAQMTKGLYTLPNIRQRSTVKRHFYLNFLSLTAALWTNTLKSVSNPATTRSWVLKNYHKYMRGCCRGPSSINPCPPFLSSPQVSLENVSTSPPPPFDRTYIFGVCGGQSEETLWKDHPSPEARPDCATLLGKCKVQSKTSIIAFMEKMQW